MITEDDDTLASDLSGGNQQKTLIGRELAGEPKVLLIDEPTKGVDVGARSEIYQRLRELAESGYAVVVSSSDGIELEGLCDRVAVFARGQIVCELSDEELTDGNDPGRPNRSFGRSVRWPGLLWCSRRS